MNDFANGFSIKQKSNSRKQIKEYLVIETKVTDICPFCHSTDITRSKRFESHWVYAVVEDQFSYCQLKRYKYHCKPCDTFFYNTETQRAYRNTDKFSKCFIEKALNLWLDRNKIEEGKDQKQITLGKLASEIGISRSSLSDWNKRLIDVLPENVPIMNSSLALISFVDCEGIRRGFFCKLTNDQWIPIAAIDHYTSEWISDYLRKTDINNRVDVDYIYFDYAPGLGMTLREYFILTRIGMNLNNLFTQIRQCLSSFTEEQANQFVDELGKKMFPVGKYDAYATLQIPAHIREYLGSLPPEEHYKFQDIIDQANNDFILNATQMRIAHFSTEKLRRKIRKMVGYNHPYENIVLALLYNNPEYAEAIRLQAQTVADEFGKKFEFVLPTSTK